MNSVVMLEWYGCWLPIFEIFYMKHTLSLKRIGQISLVLVSIVLFSINIDLGQLSTSVADQQYVEGQVISVNADEVEVQDLVILLKSGARVSVNNDYSISASERRFAVGDKVVLDQYQNEFYIVDYVRSPALFLLFGLFLVVVLIVNRGKGLTSILSMGFSFLVLFKLVLPLLLRGVDPVFAALLGAPFMLP